MNHPSRSPVPVILTLGGFDPSAGAGVLADLKTFAAHNCYGVAAITALTIQNTQGVTSVLPLPTAGVKESIGPLLADLNLTAIKIGMLANRAHAEVAEEILSSNPALLSVLDPARRSLSGVNLLDDEGFTFLRGRLLSRVTVITPNLAEAAELTGLAVENVDGMKKAANRLIEMGARAAVITGGHLEKPTDVCFDGTEIRTFVGDRVKPDNTHGTGCTFAAAIAANLALGRQLADAVMLAKAYVMEAIRKAYPVGSGRLPLDHLYRMHEAPRLVDYSPPVPEGAT
jgi:hydroxymethylpyrimidine kinase/phosphomethylpyrimidine kinase